MASAPTFEVARRDVVAVEHPMIIKNLDNALKTFGSGAETTGRPFRRIVELDDPEGCIPLYLRYQDPMSTPILSHNSSTNNILLQITVPKRTGRKRKRGSQDPYSSDPGSSTVTEQDGPEPLTETVRSHSRNDNPLELLRTLKDNVGKYKVEAVAEIDRTHRFRGLADFHQSTSNTEFAPKFKELVYPGEMDKIRQFKFNPERGWKKNEELIPPPILTHHVLPFNWGWHQNPNIIQTVNQTTGESALLNRSRSRKFQIEYLGHNAEDTPQKSPFEVPNDPDLQKLIIELKEALEERPLWTRRALANRIGNSPQFYLFKFALQYVGYQFKGGPFRDVVIKFGIDPRTDSKYRMYQTIFFKLYEEEEKGPFRKWHDNRSISLSKRTKLKDLTTHLFDGKSLTLDGKVWQFCDITDPFLANLIKNAPVCHEFSSTGDGYFYNGSWAKIRAVMKLKLAAIRLGKTINDADFDVIHKIPDIVEDNKKISNKIGVPLPDIKLTDEEREKLRAKGLGSLGGSIRRGDAKGKARKTRLRDRHAGERRAKSLEAQKAGGLPSLLPSIGTSVLDPALSRVDPHGVDGVDQDVQAGNGEGMEAGDDMDIDDDEDSGLEDEDSDDVDGDGESDLDDDRLRGADEEGNGSNVEDVTDYSKYYIPRVAPAER